MKLCSDERANHVLSNRAVFNEKSPRIQKLQPRKLSICSANVVKTKSNLYFSEKNSWLLIALRFFEKDSDLSFSGCYLIA